MEKRQKMNRLLLQSMNMKKI